MLGASILLMVAGIHSLAPQLTLIWLAAIAAATPIAICTAFGEWPPLRCWVFAVALGLSAWAAFKVDATIRHGEVAAFSVTLLLVAAWTIVSVHTVNAYLSPNVLNSSIAPLSVLLLYWVLTLTVLARAGATVFRRRR
jgi:hypothetical protein